jgi:HEPN domain-containing protein
VTLHELARSYLRKVEARLKALATLKAEGDYSDVVREAQETVELCLKGMLRAVGVEPPKFHDVGQLLLDHRDRFPADVRREIPRCAQISSDLREDRELAFYGDVDFIPTERYSSEQADRALADADWVVAVARRAIGGLSG